MKFTCLKRTIGHWLRIAAGRPDPAWEFHRFEETVNPLTWRCHDELLRWAREASSRKEETEADEMFRQSEDPVVKQGYELRRKTLAQFRNKLVGMRDLRLLVHVPSAADSPGGFSAFNNLVGALRFIGVHAEVLDWDEPTAFRLKEFGPSVLITSDSPAYLQSIDWGAVARYRQNHSLKVGLTASLEEYGNSPLPERLRWAREHGVDFYYSFRSSEYVAQRKAYRRFFDEGYRIVSVELGANVLQYYPVPNVRRDLDYVFLASRNPGKWSRYFSHLSRIVSRHSGFIDGPGWSHVKRWAPQETHRFIYARSRVGINLHIPDSIEWANELNERTYILAACGVPQLVDNAQLLPDRFKKESMFIAETPKMYEQLFDEILLNPEEAQKRALAAQQEVFEKHTTFHRAEGFALALSALLNRC